jgi:hypothetical protein
LTGVPGSVTLLAVVGVKKQLGRTFDGKLIFVDGKLAENTVKSRQTLSNRVHYCQRSISQKEY